MKEFKPTKLEKTVISIRLDVEILNKIDTVANETDISRNEFILQIPLTVIIPLLPQMGCILHFLLLVLLLVWTEL